eukprot:m.27700 g.27700  ORF g.27700 m.27700 type:complete len:273 (+) comp9033_c0_seq4:67-885(+)
MDKNSFREKQMKALQAADSMKRAAESRLANEAKRAATSAQAGAQAPAAARGPAPASTKSEDAKNAAVLTAISNILRYLKDKEMAVELNKVLQDLNLLSSPLVARIRDTVQNNEKIEVEGTLVSYRTPYPVRNYDQLLALLKEMDAKGLGGLLTDHIKDSYKAADEDIKRLKAEKTVYTVMRREPPRCEVLFYCNPQFNFQVDDSLKEQWGQCPVASKHPTDIERALVAGGKQSMRVEMVARPDPKAAKKRAPRGVQKVHESMAILEDLTKKK